MPAAAVLGELSLDDGHPRPNPQRPGDFRQLRHGQSVDDGDHRGSHVISHMNSALIAIPTLMMSGDAAALGSQWQEYQADVPKTIVELQPFRQTASVEFQMAGDWGQATLVNLNPLINAWFLLTLWSPGAPGAVSYHLENPAPKTQTLTLSEAYPYGIQISAAGRTADCELWPAGRTTELQQARHSDLPYAPLCADRLYLRNQVAGTYTHLERVTNFLRDHVWGGEQIVGFVRKQFFSDAFIERDQRPGTAQSPEPPAASPHKPRAAPIAQAFAAQSVIPEHLGIDIGQGSGGVAMGQWYAC